MKCSICNKYLFYFVFCISLISEIKCLQGLVNNLGGNQPRRCSVVCENWGEGERAFLAINGVIGGDKTWQWAFFGTQEYINSDPKYSSNLYLELIPQSNPPEYYIRCSPQNNHDFAGGSSYLTINGRPDNGSYQWAFFGTVEYVNSDSRKFSRRFVFQNAENGEICNPISGHEYLLGCIFDQNQSHISSYLAINGLVTSNQWNIDRYQWAFLGTREYIEKDNKKYKKRLVLRFNN